MSRHCETVVRNYDFLKKKLAKCTDLPGGNCKKNSATKIDLQYEKNHEKFGKIGKS